MTPDDVRAAAGQLVEFHDRFAPLFGRDENRRMPVASSRACSTAASGATPRTSPRP